jgi:hypothetical protein
MLHWRGTCFLLQFKSILKKGIIMDYEVIFIATNALMAVLLYQVMTLIWPQ